MSAVLALKTVEDLKKVEQLMELKEKGEKGDQTFFKCPQCGCNAAGVKLDSGVVFATCASECFEATI